MFAVVAAPVHSLSSFLHALLWIWFHLLQCNVSNQYRSAEEDFINRPWRPIPSGRVSYEDAMVIRICLIPLCLWISSLHGWDVALCSISLTITMIVYDEFQLAGHWIGKNLCNVPGYLSFEVGATKIMGKPPMVYQNNTSLLFA